jgi:hypothetical protein
MFTARWGDRPVRSRRTAPRIFSPGIFSLKNFFTRIFTGVLPFFVARADAHLKFFSSLFFILAPVQRALAVVGKFCEERGAKGAS